MSAPRSFILILSFILFIFLATGYPLGSEITVVRLKGERKLLDKLTSKIEDLKVQEREEEIRVSLLLDNKPWASRVFYSKPWKLRWVLSGISYCEDNFLNFKPSAISRARSSKVLKDLKTSCSPSSLRAEIELNLSRPVPHTLNYKKLIRVEAKRTSKGVLMILTLDLNLGTLDELNLQMDMGNLSWRKRLYLKDYKGWEYLVEENLLTSDIKSLTLIGGSGKQSLEELLQSGGCIAGINAGYFMPSGAPAGFFLLGDKLSPPVAYRPPRHGVVLLKGRDSYILYFLEVPNRLERLKALLRELESRGEIRWGFSAGPLLFKAGRPLAREKLEAFDAKGNDISGPAERSVLIAYRDGSVGLFTVNTLAPDRSYRGPSLRDLRRILIKYKPLYALNLDGGGSTQMVFLGSQVDLKGLGYPWRKFRRDIVSALGLRTSYRITCDFDLSVKSVPGGAELTIPPDNCPVIISFIPGELHIITLSSGFARRLLLKPLTAKYADLRVGPMKRLLRIAPKPQLALAWRRSGNKLRLWVLRDGFSSSAPAGIRIFNLGGELIYDWEGIIPRRGLPLRISPGASLSVRLLNYSGEEISLKL